MSKVITFVAFNFITHSTKTIIIFVKSLIRIFYITSFIMILGIFIATYFLGVSTLCIGSTIYIFIPKIITRITQAKKNILVHGCGCSSNWCYSYEIMNFFVGILHCCLFIPCSSKCMIFFLILLYCWFMYFLL
jgi:hypothetical protein